MEVGRYASRAHARKAGAVAVIGAPLWRAECVHVAEGLADALAVAAREDGAALAVGGASGFGRLAPDLAALAVPVVVWPDRDDSGAGRITAGRLVATLRGRGAVARLATVPDGRTIHRLGGTRITWKRDPGLDPAAMAEEAAKAAEAFDEAKRAALSGDWPATRGRPPGKPKPAYWPG